jgi:hypothetical protein
MAVLAGDGLPSGVDVTCGLAAISPGTGKTAGAQAVNSKAAAVNRSSKDCVRILFIGGFPYR